jgi:hypothetical protein
MRQKSIAGRDNNAEHGRVHTRTHRDGYWGMSLKSQDEVSKLSCTDQAGERHGQKLPDSYHHPCALEPKPISLLSS